MISRRDLILGISSLAVAACSSQGGKTSPTKTVSMLYFAGLPEGKRIQAAIAPFEKQTGIKVIYEELPYDSIRPQQLASFRQQTGKYDLIFVDDVWMYEYAKRGFIRPLQPYIDRDRYDVADLVPKVVDAEGRLDGQFWLLPQRADVQVLFYNRAIFSDPQLAKVVQGKTGKALAVPETWQDYLAIARALHGETIRGETVIGSGETLKRPHFAFEFFATRYWSLTGQDFLAGDGTPIFASPAGRRALEFMGALRSSWAPGSLNAAHDETASVFSGGRVALAPQWYGFYSTFKADEALGKDLGVTLMPGVRLPDGSIRRAPSIGGGSLGIAANASDPDAAWEFIKWITSPEIMRAGAVAGEIVTRRSAYSGPRVRANNPAVDTYLASLEVSKFRPRSIDYAAIETAIGEAVSRFLAGEEDAERALARAAAEVRAVNAKAQ